VRGGYVKRKTDLNEQDKFDAYVEKLNWDD